MTRPQSYVDVANQYNETALPLIQNEEIRKKIKARINLPPESALLASGGLPLAASTQITAPSVILPDESEIKFQELIQYFGDAKTDIPTSSNCWLVKDLGTLL